MLYAFLLVIHLIVSVLLVVAILMQRAKGGGLAGIAGGAASSAYLGGREAATLLHKGTVILALVFGINCMLLGVLSKGQSTPRSVTQEAMQSEPYPLDFLGGGQGEPAGAAGEQAPATGGATGG
ncbi:MAG TPA: preprotein translocase subunit SecG [Bacteroidetes bacterium]|nr:preprotein translocase subunit SecG [Bacteroidota bacterium]